jgi:hypothetical protein
MGVWLIVLFNLAIVGSWAYLLYLVYNLDPKIQAEWKGTKPSWADEYNSFITSVKTTSFINGGLVVLTIITALYKQYTSTYSTVVGGRRR